MTKILTLENEALDLNTLPDQIEEDIRFSVLDNSDKENPDFFYIPLIFLEAFSSPGIVMKIGNHEIQMPIDWHIAVGCSESGNDLEVLPLTSISDRGFEAFLFNPLTSFKADFADVQVTNYYNDVKWYFPKVRQGQLLSIPLEDKPNPLCAYFIKDVTRQTELIKYGELL
jgi:hypothetical protein|tara:strand:+ start:1589 stop:2098 length:510 start_codon:yes stop_codon:yes gene_type:complete